MVLATSLFSEAALRFVLLGLATGALTALVALAIVLVYRASGVLNFSAGAFGGIAAYYCYDIRDDVPTALAVAGGLVLGVLLGLVTFGVLSLLRDASRLAKLIATLALFSAGQAFMILRWGVGVVQPESLLPTRNVTLWGDLRIGLDRLLLIGIALACAAVLRLVYTRTLFGLVTSAVAENRRVAASAGWSPNRIELVNFAVAGGLSALAAILLAPIVTLNAAVLSVAVLPALAAALVGRFSSFGITVGAALLIGVVQSEILLFQPDIAEWLDVSASSLTGLVQAVPLGDHPRLHGRDGTLAPPAGRDRRPAAATRVRAGVAAPARRRGRSSAPASSPASTPGPTPSSPRSPSPSSSHRSSWSPATPDSCRCASSPSPGSGRGWRLDSCRPTAGRSRPRCSRRWRAPRSSGS